MKDIAEDYGDDNFSIYNSRGYKVACNQLNDTNYRTAVLPKGTYYIRVYTYANYNEHYNRIFQFWWR